LFQTSPKKLIGQRSEGDVLSLVGDQAGFADFAQFVQEEESCVDGGQPRRHGAFEVYRKPVSSKMTFFFQTRTVSKKEQKIEIMIFCKCALNRNPMGVKA
jgi:hypothetical protein